MMPIEWHFFEGLRDPSATGREAPRMANLRYRAAADDAPLNCHTLEAVAGRVST